LETLKFAPQPRAYQATEDGGWQGLIATMFFAVFGVLLLVVLSYRPVSEMGSAGMVFPFSMTEDDILQQVGAAGGRVVRFGGFGHLAVVVNDDGSMPEADAMGALFALSPLITSACFDADDVNNAF